MGDSKPDAVTGPAVVPVNGIDPLVALATGVHAAPGVYALLLGSGVSTSAGVPTGWQVVTDLVSRAAAAANPQDGDAAATAASDPEAWWAANGDGEPLGYSGLLASLAATPAARQALLAGYFEPTDEDREEGRKIPGAAHRAVAQLVARGAVRVILTTNFDRLLERALEEAGVQPQVIHRPEQLEGTTPLAHARVTVVKLHGDYADLEQRNTVDELSSYPPAYDTFLDRVFDEYGLIVCGWSGEWDHALVAALERRKSRRYPLYWAAFSGPSEPARRLVAQHRATVISGTTADELFTGLTARLEALDALAAPPLSRDLAVVRLKRALPDPVRRIDVFDLVDNEVQRTVKRVTDTATYPVHLPAGRINFADFGSWMAGMRADADVLLHLLAVGVFHDDGKHVATWVRAVEDLMRARARITDTWTSGLDEYRHYPALLAVWVAGVAALRAGREELLARLLLEPKWRPWVNDTTPGPAVTVLHPYAVLNADWVNRMPRWGEGHHGWLYPHSHLLRIEAREPLWALIRDEDAYQEACDRLECLASFLAMDQEGASIRRLPWMGEFVLESRTDRDGNDLTARVANEISEDWPLLKGGSFGGDVGRAREIAEQTRTFIRENARRW